MTSTQLLETIVVDACIDVFAAHEVTLTATRDPPGGDGFALCGVIGFAADGARGTLMLAMTRELMGPARARVVDAGRGWIAELANQLLGRVTHRALAHRTTVTSARPPMRRGHARAPVPRIEVARQFHASTGGQVCLRADVEVDDGFTLSAHPCDIVGAASEGEASLF